MRPFLKWLLLHDHILVPSSPSPVTGNRVYCTKMKRRMKLQTGQIRHFAGSSRLLKNHMRYAFAVCSFCVDESQCRQIDSGKEMFPFPEDYR